MRFALSATVLSATAFSCLLTGAIQATDTPIAPTIPKPYLLKKCLVSGAALGDMGEPVVQVYDGQEIKFCCGGCPKAFNKDPAKYIAEMNKQVATLAAAAAPAVGAAPAPAAKVGKTGMDMDCCK